MPETEVVNGKYADAAKYLTETSLGRRYSVEETLALRKKFVGKSMYYFYEDDPLKIVRGRAQYLYDKDDNRYLDCINNVSHVGHCHPHVIEASHKQMSQLNTNARFLHDNLVTYAERLAKTMPGDLSICFFTCTGTEANDLAVRLARCYTNHNDVIVLEDAYHGNGSSTVELSSYSFNKPGYGGKPEHVHVAKKPECYRGIYRGNPNSNELGIRYAELVQEEIQMAHKKGQKIAAFLAETMPSCAGQFIPPPGYLRNVYKYVREAGGICIADEVQTGFGRMGKYFWSFEHQGVIPDIVTLGKPIGNGHPLSVVVTTPAIAAKFEKFTYFNTFAANPVSCAIGHAVLDVIENENLQKNAETVGYYLLQRAKELLDEFKIIGDVRGLGLFLGIELVKDRKSREPAVEEAASVVDFMKEKHVLIAKDGPDRNIIKLKPPLCFTKANVDTFIATFKQALNNLKL
ncbi:Ethanolamine-phosphate phospho-lyase [Trichoplax sp. H2]|nr:Ethanolamine-phosphate phospho-lyase [Trichoplax sp. H2]|eukprot:RDD38979.1 Ethanolamine-phosphate phospho-lyase [Trichoplax sp. H2]